MQNGIQVEVVWSHEREKGEEQQKTCAEYPRNGLPAEYQCYHLASDDT